MSEFREAILLLSNLDFYVTSPSVTMLATGFMSNMLRAKPNSLRLDGAGLSPCYCEMGQSCHLRCALGSALGPALI